MKLEDALRRVEQEYERAKGLSFVRDPLAWALHKVWREVDLAGAAPKLRNQCGSCVHARPCIDFPRARSYIECENPPVLLGREPVRIRLRSAKACKRYEEREELK